MIKIYKVLKSILYWTTMVCPIIDSVRGIVHGASDAKKEEEWKKNNKDKMMFFGSLLDVQDEKEEEEK